MSKDTRPRIAIVHDWLYGGGAEQVVLALHQLYPEAPIYTSYCTDEWRQKLDNKVITGYLQRWPFAQLRKFLPILRQRWFAKLDLSGFDIIISSSGNGEAKFVTTSKDQTHICYCHTPSHFYWRHYQAYLENPGFRPKWLVRLGLKLLVRPLRRRDYEAAQKVDQFIANSTHIRNDIKKYYDRNSVVVHPPVDTEKFSNNEYRISNIEKSGFIMWGRHVPLKRFDLAIKACNQLKAPLTIVGQGPETDNLKKLAGPTITFTGWLSHDDLVTTALQHQAFLFPGEEDFGIAPVEAMSLGIPVIAYKAGGATDYVTPKKTGLFFEKQSVDAMITAIQRFETQRFLANTISQHAEQFSAPVFKASFQEILLND